MKESYLNKAHDCLKDPSTASDAEREERLKNFCDTFAEGVQEYSNMICRLLNENVPGEDFPLFYEAVRNTAAVLEDQMSITGKSALELFHSVENITVASYTSDDKEEAKKAMEMGGSIHADAGFSSLGGKIRKTAEIKMPKGWKKGPAPGINTLKLAGMVFSEDAHEHAEEIRDAVLGISLYLRKDVFPDDMITKAFYAAAFTHMISAEDVKNEGFIDLAEHITTTAFGRYEEAADDDGLDAVPEAGSSFTS